jgi:three-Cys-motif partner protein
MPMPADEHRFGGRHTDEKLRKLSTYMSTYTTALKDQGFVLAYIDAFAGSGDRVETRPTLPLFTEQGAEPEIVTVAGSARLAFETKPPFEVMVLVEKDEGRFAALKRLGQEYPQQKVHIENGDANEVVQKLCRKLPWHGSPLVPKGMRGLLFLDPYGMEVRWETIEAVARTNAIDMWCFFPLMGLYRQAARDPIRIDATKRSMLNSVLGTTEWESAWYQPPPQPDNLFGMLEDEATRVRTADVDAIEDYVRRRLASIFKGTVLPPSRIFNARGAPLASLFFAMANPSHKAVAVGTRIASYILNSGSSSHSRPR